MLGIEEHELLLALYRTVIEGKFAEDPEDRLVARSPLVAEACTRIRRALDESERARIRKLDGPRRQLATRNWKEWLRRSNLDARPRLLAVVRRRLRELHEWPALDAQARAELVSTLAAPLGLSPALRTQLVREANAHHGVGPA